MEAQKDEIICPSLTYWASCLPALSLGAKIVFADIDPATFNLDPGALESVVTDRTRAIIPVHLYGRCADMAPILDLANRRGLAVIEDAAQAFGSTESDGRQAGAIGTCGCFSFFPSKNLGAMGDGGVVKC